ncbi:AAA family ATPase [Paenibacillus sp. IB182496]|uniref:AAA family ATPase n=1 Tax=Paenibacillus sabuli TaxID=2772509 RepID=A0A927BQU7_9BACL|nr:AAA family ATPase [Paenibacillus sabuli]MBD2845053.1 AAA family ATPase [Paenibacillus sabuli]
MFNSWTLKVRDFGKISKADIRVTPFMMLVGENNSGKSYILELLWGVFKNLNSLFKNQFDEDRDFIDLCSKLNEKIKNSVTYDIWEQDSITTIDINEEQQKKLMEILNRSLKKEKDWLVKEIFNHSMEIGSLEILRDMFYNLKVEISMQNILSTEIVKKDGADEGQEVSVSKKAFFFQLLLYDPNEKEEEDLFLYVADTNNAIVEGAARAVMLRIATMLVCRGFSDSRSLMLSRKSSRKRSVQLETPVYFPASRTGFMHTYQSIISNQNQIFKEMLKNSELIKLFGQNSATNPALRLTAPVNDFLEKLSDIYIDEDQQTRYAEELSFLKQKIFNGTITKDQAQDIQFVPEQGKGIPLHVTSSLVAELAPLSLFLESQYDPQLLIIEESESHLHVGKQLELVRLFFRLINKGKAIWLTTHSDSFAQQVNNLLTLSRHPQKEKLFSELGYEAADTLSDIASSSCYQFYKSPEGNTIVEEVELGEYGYAIPTFNSVLEKLLNETVKIQDFGDKDD